MKVGDKNQKLTATVTLTDSKDSKKEITSMSDVPTGYSLDVKWEVPNNRGDEVRVSPSNGSLEVTLEALAPPETQDEEDALTVQVSVTLKKVDGSSVGEAQTDACTVVITPAEQNGLTLSPTILELAPLGSGMIYATVTPATADQAVGWESQV